MQRLASGWRAAGQRFSDRHLMEQPLDATILAT
jgi:hypothetical protein